MTPEQYTSIRKKIESRFVDDSATLDRAWVLINGTNPPSSPVVLREPDDDEAGVAAIVGHSVALPTSVGLPEETTRRRSYKGLSSDERKKQKAAYMREYQRRRALAKK